MRRAVFLFLLSAGISIPSFGSETGTYRPGLAYTSVTAGSPTQCAAHCKGDAQCKGWNFIRPRQMSRKGVCEFNAERVSPVPSPISISGDNETVRDSSHIVSAGTRTVKVGSIGAAVTTPPPISAPASVPMVAPVAMPQAAAPRPMHARNAPQLAGAPAPQPAGPRSMHRQMAQTPQIMPQPLSNSHDGFARRRLAPQMQDRAMSQPPRPGYNAPPRQTAQGQAPYPHASQFRDGQQRHMAENQRSRYNEKPEAPARDMHQYHMMAEQLAHMARMNQMPARQGQRITPRLQHQLDGRRSMNAGPNPVSAQPYPQRQPHMQGAPASQHSPVPSRQMAHAPARPNPAALQTQPQFQHHLDSMPSAPRPIPPQTSMQMAGNDMEMYGHKPVAAPQTSPYSMPDPRMAGPAVPAQQPQMRFQHHLDGMPRQMAQGSAAPQTQQPSSQFEYRSEAMPRHMAANPAGQPQPRAQTAPQMTQPYQMQDPRLAQRPTPPVQMTPHMRRGAQMAQQNLYGSLYDDVTVPLTLTPENIPVDPNAPIPTVTSVRTHPVDTRALAQLYAPPRL